MRLRRLRMAGFKTFARATDVVFDRGITAIVGPNGSGKSNLVDAVRWALGETNARELRGQRMDEVIYAGGGGRGRMSVAEVELVLDNEEGRLPLEDAEVALTRRVVRGAGDTEYRLNHGRVRLRDVERLLTATGLTQSGYAVVAQNDIDAIIEATPAHRRMLVEQAAGVRHLRAAGDEALVKVARAEAVIRRLDDLLDDADPRLAELALQAEVALEQRQITERLSELRGSLAREEWRAARGRLRAARRAGDHAAARLEAAGEAELAFSNRIEDQRRAQKAARAEHATAVEALEAARLGAERAAGDHRRWMDRMRVAVLQRASVAAELRAARAELDTATSASTRRLSVLREQLAARAADDHVAAGTAGAAEGSVQAALQAAEDSRRRLREAEARVAAARHSTAEVLSRAASVRGTLAGLAGGEGGVAHAVARGDLQARRLWDCLSLSEPDAIAAVEAALEPYLGAWIVDDPEAAAGFLDREGAREQLLAAGLEPPSAPRAPLAVQGRWLLDAVAADLRAAGALAGCGAGVWLAPDMASARLALHEGASTAVLSDGTVVTRHSLRGGGRPGQVLRMAADERRLAAELGRAEAEEASATEDIVAAHERAGAAETALASAGDALRGARSRVAEAAALVSAARDALAAVERGDDDATLLLATMQARATEAELRLLAVEAEALTAMVRLAAAAAAIADYQQAVHSALDALRRTAEPLAGIERSLLVLETERSEVAVALARAQDERAAAATEIADAETQVAELAEAVNDESDEDGADLDPQAVERAEREIVRLEN